MTLTKNLTSADGRMNLRKARNILRTYSDNGKEITPQVIDAYNLCAQFGRSSYYFMEKILGEDLAKEVVEIEKRQKLNI